VPGLAEEERSLRPADIALLYRALRKGREDSKDEPGAADFYYGELEMRRHDRTASWPERVVLWLYWLVAGYGLRATRALSCLLGLLVVATVLLAVVGFKPAPSAAPLTATIAGTPRQQRILFTATPQPAMTAERPLPDRLGTAALVAAEGAVFRTSDQALTYRGRLIQATLRSRPGPAWPGAAVGPRSRQTLTPPVGSWPAKPPGHEQLPCGWSCPRCLGCGKRYKRTASCLLRN
jgi:hypothetical protein